MSGLNLEGIAIVLGLKKPKKFAFLRNGVQPVVKVPRTLKTFDIPSTAGDVDYEIPLEKNFKYIINKGYIKVAADATVADRYMFLAIYRGSDMIWCSNRPPTAVAATVTRKGIIVRSDIGYQTATHFGWDGGTAIAGYIQAGEMIIDGDTDKLKVIAKDAVAGDAVTGKIEFEVLPK